MDRYLRYFFCFSAVLLLSGCVVGQSIPIAPTPSSATAPISKFVGELKVTDDRPYVTSGDKPPYYIGKFRSGFGIPYDVSTDGHVPLKDLISAGIAKQIEQLGKRSSTVRIQVLIKDWNFDAYQNGTFTYELLVTATDAESGQKHEETFSEKIGVTGTLWSGGKGGFERDMPKIFEGIMARIVAPGTVIYNAVIRAG